MNRIANSASLRFGIALLAIAPLASGSVAVGAPNVAIVTGSFYTTDLYNVLTGGGVSVTEINSYTAASLAPYTHVIHDGNTFSTDMGALTNYVNAGGTLIELPWFWSNNSPPPALAVFNTIDDDIYSAPYPGINALLPAHPLLAGVSFPPPGGFNVGYDNQATFAPGVTGIAAWADGTGTALLGEKSLGAGKVIGINMHVITSDTAYQVIHEPFATQLFLNAVGAIPEPNSLVLACGACLGLATSARSRRRLRR